MPSATGTYDARVTATARSLELRSVAHGIADELPFTVEEVVLTGSVSRGVADDISDIEMLIVTEGEVDLGDCFLFAARCGVTDLGMGEQGRPTSDSGYRRPRCSRLSRSRWSRAYAAICSTPTSTAADHRERRATARTWPPWTSSVSGSSAAGEDLADYPDELANAQIEAAALDRGGFHASGLLTLLRPGERLALVEWLVDDAVRIVRIVFALNRIWPPTLKRIVDRTGALTVKPDRLAERIAEALTEPDPRRALLAMSQVQAETLALAPDGPNVERARKWIGEGRQCLAHPTTPGP